jgi:hypothetical protein
MSSEGQERQEGPRQPLLAHGEKTVRGPNMIEVSFMHVWKCQNKTHVKNCTKVKKKRVGGEGRLGRIIEGWIR